jgi:chemotaxis protein CheD
VTTLAPLQLDGLVRPSSGRVYLHPGEYAIATEPTTMTTILGSCVSVCLCDPAAGIGGLNHFLLPRAPLGQFSARFGDQAVPALIRCMTRLGAERTRMRATVVGGACVLDAYRHVESHIGRQNARVALEMLAEAGIHVATLDVGGNRARRIQFHPHTGDVVVRAV